MGGFSWFHLALGVLIIIFTAMRNSASDIFVYIFAAIIIILSLSGMSHKKRSAPVPKAAPIKRKSRRKR